MAVNFILKYAHNHHHKSSITEEMKITMRSLVENIPNNKLS